MLPPRQRNDLPACRVFVTPSGRSTTSPTTASPGWRSSPTSSASRSSSRVPPAPARRSWPSRSPRSPARELIRLQCYEGLDESKALYEWNYKKQLLRIQTERGAGGDGEDWTDVKDDIFSDEFLLTRPLLEAITSPEPVVLLIDEVDRVEVETEALLLEILSDYQVSIPELGTITATQIPLVFLTSNNTRELSEALKRRCLYLHVDYPQLEREKEIVLAKVPGITDSLADQVARVVRSIRQMDLKKAPSVSETLDWARTLMILNIDVIDEKTAKETLNILLKYQTDIAKAAKELSVDELIGPTGTRTMLDLLNGFVVELRNAGLPVSLTENLDAMEAVQHIPIEDREAFKYALGATLIKNHAHWRSFETVFEVYFSLRGPEYKLVHGDDDTDIDELWREMQEQQRQEGRAAPAAWTT